MPFVIVQVRVAELPAARPVTVDVADEGVVRVAEPEVTVHAPVPLVAVFPASVKLELLQLNWSAPALAVVGNALFVMIT